MSAFKLPVDKIKTAIQKTLGEMIVERAKELCPEHSQFLKESIGWNIENGKLFVFAGSPYAEYVEYGTGLYNERKEKRHYIYPKTKKALSWIGLDGIRIFARRTKGQHPQPFLRPAIYEILHIRADEVARRAQNYLNLISRGYGGMMASTGRYNKATTDELSSMGKYGNS